MRIIAFILSLILAVACETGFDRADNTPNNGNNTEQPGEGDNNNGENGEGETPDTPTDPEPEPEPEPEKPNTPIEWGDERAYVFDLQSVPEVRMTVSLDEWNRMLAEYDRNNDTKEYFHCDVKINLKGEEYSVTDAGVRLKGNTSRRRPENGNGNHKVNNADWQHCHFQFNFRKYHKDEEHTIRGVRKMYLKWFKDDPAYCREIFCYDLFRRFGVWTAIENCYCRLWVHVEGDSKPAYYGVYEMNETIDDTFLKMRKDNFGSHKGNLWKCNWGASLNYDRDKNASMGESDDHSDPTYEVEELGDDNLSAAKTQLLHFMKQLRDLKGQQLHDWLGKTIDIELLLRTYAVNVAVGMWDDYWNNTNNFYIYFNSTDTQNYKFYFIPYDYDNSLGTSHNCGVQNDSGRHNPLSWGNSNDSPLLAKILQFEDYRKIYVDALKELCSSSGDFYYTTAIARIKSWHSMISNYVDNDTDEDTKIKDRPAGWGNHSEYRLWESTDSNTNFFCVKAASIPSK